MRDINLKTDISSLDKKELERFLESLGEKGFRARQIFTWLHKRGAESFDMMSDIPEKLRAKLNEKTELTRCETAGTLVSNGGSAVKYLFCLNNNIIIESVLMKYIYNGTGSRLSVCVSSQAGCRMGCGFCASDSGGFIRNLTAGEMLSQVYKIQKISGAREKISGVVMMGQGEPLDNFDQTVKFIRILSDPDGLGMSLRRVTLSTCGLVPRIYGLAALGLPVKLAVSLHAPDDITRIKMMPAARKYSIKEIIKAADAYYEAVGRRVTYEYALADGVNDTAGHARSLAELLFNKSCHVNLLTLNPAGESGFKPARDEKIKAFAGELRRGGINATVRRKLGADVTAACGQLRSRVSLPYK